MNKPLPWNVKGVGFDAREAARLAAKRAGVPLGEWLNGIISERAAELGVEADDVTGEDRLDAIAARLSSDDTESMQRVSDDRFRTSVLPPAPAPVSETRVREQAAAATPVHAMAFELAGVDSDERFGERASHVQGHGNDVPARASTALVGQSFVNHRGGRKGVEAASPALSPRAESDRLDDRLNAILAKLNRSFEAAAEVGEGAVRRAGAARADDDARSPQSITDAAAARGQPLDAAIRSAEPTPEPASSLTAAATETPFAELQAAFKTLADKLEAQVGDAQAQAKQPATGGSQAGVAARAGRRDMAAAPTATVARPAELRSMQTELAELASRVADFEPHRSIAALETAVRELSGRIDLSRLDGVQASMLGPIERLGREVRESIRSVDATQAVDTVRKELKSLTAKLEGQPSRSADAASLDSLRGEMREMRDQVSALAGRFAATDMLREEIAALNKTVGSLAVRATPAATRELAKAICDINDVLHRFGPTGGFGALDKKIDALVTRVETLAERRDSGVAVDRLMQQIDETHTSILGRLSDRMASKADFDGLEQSIGSLSAKIDTIGRASHDMTALYGLVGNLAERVQDAHSPGATGETYAALQAQMGQLIERLDRSEAGSGGQQGIERLIGDLFLQIEQSRDTAIDAAENAARVAAQDTLRAAMVNPSLNGAELTVQTGLDVDHVSQELAELRRVQEASDHRVTLTLTALNTTLERLVDHMTGTAVSAAALSTPLEVAEVDRPSDKAPRRRRRATPDAEPQERRSFGSIPPFDPEQFLIEPSNSETAAEPRHTATAAVDAPIPQVGSDAPAGVAPLIAAARRAAQAAQASALEAAIEADQAKSAAADAPAGKARSFFGNRRRPMLLGLAGLVLLLGTLQIVRLSGWQKDSDASATSSAPAEAGTTKDSAPLPQPSEPKAEPKSDKGASLLSPVPALGPAAPAPRSTSASAQPDPTPTGSIAPQKPGSDLANLTTLSQGLRDLATGGNPAAQYEVASRLSDGRGMARDSKQAQSWFERSATLGFAPAQYRLGSIYEKGVGTTADPALAVAWYEKAAAGGNVRAMHNLAVMSAEGAGGKPDYGKAVSWFTKAANYGVRDSQYNLAILLARGLGVPQNLVQSYGWFSAAAGQGDSDAAAKRDSIAAKLDTKSMADAKAFASALHTQTPNAAANDVAPPPGGWDAASPAKSAASKVEARAAL